MIATLLALTQIAAAADSIPGTGGTVPHAAPTLPTIVAAARSGRIAVDGRLDDPAWSEAIPHTGFIQGEPVEGAAPEERTVVRVLFDQDAIYIGARLYERDAARVSRQLARRDEQGPFDFFDVSLSPNRDGLTGYRFRVSAAGVQSDAYLFDDTRDDPAWDAVWQSAVTVDEEGWTAEIRIPLSQLRFQPSRLPQTWRINFTRRRIDANERTYFALESRRRSGRVSVFGEVEGLVLPSSRAAMEFRPYVVAMGRSAPAAEGNPFFSGRSTGGNAGGEFRMGLGGSFMLNTTFNPDFGQVEVDPAVINLTANETFFPERRPFFVQDARLLGFGLSGMQNGLFYTRRIGREPQVRSASGATFNDVPGTTTILGAAKITGRTRGGLSVGALASVSAEEQGRAWFSEGERRFVAEPQTVAAVASAAQEFRRGASQASATVTALTRDLPADGSLDFLPARAFSAGVNFEHTWTQKTWALTGFVAGSRVEGTPAAMIRIQRNSNHYFQRPDATRVRVDSSGTSMMGHEWRLQLERRSGLHWTGAIWTGQRSAGFEVNDLGFQQGGERLDAGFRIGYQEITPGPLFQSYRISLFTFNNWRHEALDDVFSPGSWRRAWKRSVINTSANFTFRNYWELQVQGRLSPTVQSDNLTRGGPIMTDPGTTTASAELTTDRRRAANLSLDVESSWGRAGNSSTSVSAELGLRPSPGVLASVGPRMQWQFDTQQYVARIGTPAYEPTFGSRYLFGDLERRTFSLETRLNVTFSPRLTLQLFAQPLLSTGDYVGYKQLRRPRSFDFDVFDQGTATVVAGTVRCTGGRICPSDGRQHVDVTGDGVADFSFAEQDFRIRSLRGNAVLRWEYRPGSALFLVWQQRRSYRDTDASRFDLAGEFGGLWSEPADNTLMLKVSYWFGL